MPSVLPILRMPSPLALNSSIRASTDGLTRRRPNLVPFALARAARAKALLADDQHFAEQFAIALRHHESTSDAFERARTELYFGERLRRESERGPLVP